VPVALDSPFASLTSGLSPRLTGGYVASPSDTPEFAPFTLRKLHISPDDIRKFAALISEYQCCRAYGFALLHPKGVLRSPFTNPKENFYKYGKALNITEVINEYRACNPTKGM